MSYARHWHEFHPDGIRSKDDSMGQAGQEGESSKKIKAERGSARLMVIGYSLLVIRTGADTC
jgi:hypothetical protein